MTLRYPEYYEGFQCIAGKCEDTCCAGWEIDIDDTSYEYYMQLPGEFGERIRKSIKEYQSEEYDIYESHGFILGQKKRCPFLNQDNLCDIILELGEESLCYVCTHTPRNYFEYGNVREISVSPSCPEAGRLMFKEEAPIRFLEKESAEMFDTKETEEELLFAEQVEKARDASIFILQNRFRAGKEQPITIRLCSFLLFAHRIQTYINERNGKQILVFSEEVLEGKWNPYDEMKGKGHRAHTVYDDFCGRLESFAGLDPVNEEWVKSLERLRVLFLEQDRAVRYVTSMQEFKKYIKEKKREYEYEHLLVYYAYLMIPRAMDDENFWGKAQFAAASFLMIRDMDLEVFFRNMQEFSKEDRLFHVRIYAKEVEHSEENIAMLEEAFIFEEYYKLENLITQILI